MLDVFQGGTECRVLLFGPNNSGKSSLMDTLQNNFNYVEKEYYESAGVLGVTVNKHLNNLGFFSFKITEIAGYFMGVQNMKFLSKANIRIQQNNFLIFTFNRQEKKQFTQLKKALTQLREQLKDKFVYILGTFSDIDESNLEVTETEGRKLASLFNGQYMSFSSKLKHNVKALFSSIASCQEFINRHPNNLSELKVYIDFISKIKREKEIALYQYKMLQNQYESIVRKEIITDILKLITPINKSIVDILENQPIYQFIFL